jgi:hypothetical protein
MSNVKISYACSTQSCSYIYCTIRYVPQHCSSHTSYTQFGTCRSTVPATLATHNHSFSYCSSVSSTTTLCTVALSAVQLRCVLQLCQQYNYALYYLNTIQSMCQFFLVGPCRGRTSALFQTVRTGLSSFSRQVSDNDCVLVVSQGAEGQGIGCVTGC